MTDFIGFPKLIKAVRKSQGMTQKDFADKFEVSRTAAWMWEKGVNQAPYPVLEYALQQAGYFEQDKKLQNQIIRIKSELGDKLDAIKSEIQVTSEA